MLYVDARRDGRPFLRRIPAVLMAALLLIATGGCDGIGRTSDEDTQFSETVASETLNAGVVNVDQIDKGQYGAIVEGTQRVLRDQEAYASFWETLHADQDSVPDRPTVDFDQRIVVAVVLGRRPNGGYSVEIDEVLANEGGGQLQVQFTETVPGEGCVTTQVLTSPYVLATVKAQDEDVTFDGSKASRSC